MKKRILGIILILFSLFIFTSEKFNIVKASSTNETNACTIDVFIEKTNKIESDSDCGYETKTISADELEKRGSNYYISSQQFSRLTGDALTKVNDSTFTLMNDGFGAEYNILTQTLTYNNKTLNLNNISRKSEEFVVSIDELSKALGYSCELIDNNFVLDRAYFSKRIFLRSNVLVDNLKC